MAMKSRGFSLVELLVALGVAAVLLALAAPGFGHLRADAALRSAARQTLAAVHLARRLALARGESVTVCPSADGMRCGFGGAHWLLFANQPAGVDSRREEGELILRQWQLPARVLVNGSRGYAAFQPRPGAATTVTFEFTHPGRPAAIIRLVISQTGRPRIEGL